MMRTQCRTSLTQFLLVLINLNAVMSQESSAAGPSEKGLFDFLFNNPCLTCACGQPVRSAGRLGRLLGGTYLRTHEYPWLVLIQTQNGPVSGTIISDKYILTGASPVIGLTPFDVKVTIGQFDRCFPEPSIKNISVDLIHLHPDFNPGNRAHDIALMRLASSLKFERNVLPICLPISGALYADQVGTVAGWHESVPDSGPDAVLSCRPRKLQLPVLDYGECATSVPQPQYLSPDKGCVGVLGGRGSPICGVDAGAAVAHRNYAGTFEMIGILSDRNICGDLATAAMYTKISKHVDWIIEQTRDSCYCYRP